MKVVRDYSNVYFGPRGTIAATTRAYAKWRQRGKLTVHQIAYRSRQWKMCARRRRAALLRELWSKKS